MMKNETIHIFEGQKPILDVIYHWSYYCLKCEEFLTSKNGGRPRYCSCGQAIDWSDAD